jgi:hypothetical protein
LASVTPLQCHHESNGSGDHGDARTGEGEPTHTPVPMPPSPRNKGAQDPEVGIGGLTAGVIVKPVAQLPCTLKTRGCLLDIASGERERAQFVIHPCFASGVAEFTRRPERRSQDPHQFGPPQEEQEQGDKYPGDPQDISQAVVTVEPLQQGESGPCLGLEQVSIEWVAGQDRAHERAGALKPARSALG